MVRQVGGEITEERKPIDYVPEPYRHDLIEQFDKTSYLKQRIKEVIEIQGQKLENEPVTQKDIANLLEMLNKITIQLFDANTAVIEITALFFKDKELSQS